MKMIPSAIAFPVAVRHLAIFRTSQILALVRHLFPTSMLYLHRNTTSFFARRKRTRFSTQVPCTANMLEVSVTFMLRLFGAVFIALRFISEKTHFSTCMICSHTMMFSVMPTGLFAYAWHAKITLFCALV